MLFFLTLEKKGFIIELGRLTPVYALNYIVGWAVFINRLITGEVPPVS